MSGWGSLVESLAVPAGGWIVAVVAGGWLVFLVTTGRVVTRSQYQDMKDDRDRYRDAFIEEQSQKRQLLVTTEVVQDALRPRDEGH